MRKSFVIVFHGYIRGKYDIDRHSSWEDIRLWKLGWTAAINQMDGGIWWQRLNECKRHQSASDYCNCHQIPPRPLTGHADPLAPHIPPPAQLDPAHHRCSSWNTHERQRTYTRCPLVLSHLQEILLCFFFHLSEMSCTQKGLMCPFDSLIWSCFQPISTWNRSMFVDL